MCGATLGSSCSWKGYLQLLPPTVLVLRMKFLRLRIIHKGQSASPNKGVYSKYTNKVSVQPQMGAVVQNEVLNLGPNELNKMRLSSKFRCLGSKLAWFSYCTVKLSSCLTSLVRTKSVRPNTYS